MHHTGSSWLWMMWKFKVVVTWRRIWETWEYSVDKKKFQPCPCNYIVSFRLMRQEVLLCNFQELYVAFLINSQLFAVDFSNLQNFVCNTASLHVWLCVCMCMHACTYESESCQNVTLIVQRAHLTIWFQCRNLPGKLVCITESELCFYLIV